jgi:hypothetical protein
MGVVSVLIQGLDMICICHVEHGRAHAPEISVVSASSEGQTATVGDGLVRTVWR